MKQKALKCLVSKEKYEYKYKFYVPWYIIGLHIFSLRNNVSIHLEKNQLRGTFQGGGVEYFEISISQ